ncbi:MAG: anti-sigma factor [Pyrinomonadaceae bacterium]
MSESSPEKVACQSELIIAYLDGEMTTDACANFESHAQECAECRATFREHRQLLCLLESELDDYFEMPLPKNFAEIVTAHARSDMRVAHRRGFALWLVMTLAVLCCALPIVVGSGRAFGFISTFVRGAANGAMMFGRGFYDIGIGLSVILRAVGGNLTGGARPLNLLLICLFAAAFGLLLRLIASYHQRLQTTD